MLKTRILFGFILLGFQIVWAQQEQQFTQFMFNKMAWNPGYAGSLECPVFVGMTRHQWIGLEGAPSQQTLSYHQNSFGDRVGWGMNLMRESVSINSTVGWDGAFAYRFPLLNGKMGVGLQMSFRHFRQNWLDKRLIGSQDIQTDQAVPAEVTSKLVPNFGAGIFFKEDERFFVGVSVPRLVTSNLDFSEAGSVLSREVPHLFVSGGWVFSVSDASMQFTPQVLLKFVRGAPMSADLNGNVWFAEKFLAGLTFRTGSGKTAHWGESLAILSGIQIGEKWYLGLSYDIGLTQIRRFSNGTLEALISYAMMEKAIQQQSPRDF